MDTNIISALIGAAATILAAFISKDYAERRIEKIEPTKPLDRSTTRILRLLSFFVVNSAHIIKLRVNHVYIDDRLNLIMVLNEVYEYSGYATFTISVLGQEQQKINLNLGATLEHEVDGRQYYLILTKLNHPRTCVEFQVREILRKEPI